MRTTPRSLISMFLRLHGWVAVLLMAIAAGLAVGAGVATGRAVALAERGVETVATITDRDIKTDSEGEKRYHVAFRYADRTGTVLQGRSKVDRDYYRSVRTGQTVTLVYVPGAPGLHELRHGLTGFWARVLWVGAGVVGLAGALLGQWRLRRARSALRARDRGELRTATVTQVRRTGVSVNDERQYVLEWRSADNATGNSLMNGLEHFSPLNPGDSITVFVDPHNGRAWWEGDTGPRPGRSGRTVVRR